MERQFNNGDFEKQLRDNANQYRMYPSEKVWKGIHSALHTRRRWYGLSATIMFLITGSIISYFVFNGSNKSVSNNNHQIIATNKSTVPVPDGSLVPKQQTNNLIGTYKKISKSLADGKEFEKYLNIPDYTLHTDNVQVIQGSPATTENISVHEILDLDNSDNVAQPSSESISIFIPTENFEKFSTLDISISPEGQLDEKWLEENQIDDETATKIREAISSIASENIKLNTPVKKSRLTAQIYFTPTVSYRKLTENKNIYSGPGYSYVPTIGVNNLVKHKPGMGLEFGIEGRYSLNKNLSITTGFQFNINRYDIRAYSHPYEPASVAISNSRGIDTLQQWSNYRNFSGNSPNWLENFYFQASIPVGVELILGSNDNVQWGVNANIQPTYLVSDRAYLISSDYKNYAKFPDLMRRWNYSSSVGAFVAYSTGKINWQVGPQLRYQHLSSFVSSLSVKENLFAAGLKIGVSLNQNKK